MRRLLALAAMPRGRVALAALLGAATVVFGVGLMTTSGYLISRAAQHPPVLELTVAIVGVRFFGLARPIARYLERLASHDLALRSLVHVRTVVFARIEPLAPAGLEGFRRGDLVRRMVGDVDALQGLYVRALGPVLVAATASVVCVVTAGIMLPEAGAILAAGLLAGGVGVPLVAGWAGRSAGARQAPLRGELSGELVELLRGAPELVAFGAAERAMAAVGARDRELARLARRDAWAAGGVEALSVVVTGLTAAAVLAVAVSAHAAGRLDAVLIAALALLALASFEAVAPLASNARELAAMRAAGGRVLDLVDRRPPVVDPPRPLPPPRGEPAVALDGVTARYPGADRPVLEGFDLHLDPGSRVALVGPSGAGKTTVTNLLLRFLDPEVGRVSIAGQDEREYRAEDIRGTFALAGQEAHVFNSTIRENLRLARPGASEEELVDALRRAQLADWVRTLPDGLDTLVGEDGSRLSGGQRQRLVLARALLADAPVLVLDEPTAHLDRETAEALIRDTFAAAGDRSVLLITHRSEGLGLVDRIVPCG
jgi:thiol reductant ABC exporter CydC subunit